MVAEIIEYYEQFAPVVNKSLSIENIEKILDNNKKILDIITRNNTLFVVSIKRLKNIILLISLD